MVAARIPKPIADALKVAAVHRDVAGTPPTSQAGIIAAALEAWLRENGHAIGRPGR